MTMNSVPSVLIVDDDPNECLLLAEVASIEGFTSRTASSATEIMSMLDQSPDVVVLDLIMPQMDGVEVLREMKKRGSRARIILVSGYDDQLLDTAGLLASGFKLKLAGVLNKPFAFDVFTDLLRRAALEQVA